MCCSFKEIDCLCVYNTLLRYKINIKSCYNRNFGKELFDVGKVQPSIHSFYIEIAVDSFNVPQYFFKNVLFFQNIYLMMLIQTETPEKNPIKTLNQTSFLILFFLYIYIYKLCYHQVVFVCVDQRFSTIFFTYGTFWFLFSSFHWPPKY